MEKALLTFTSEKLKEIMGILESIQTEVYALNEIIEVFSLNKKENKENEIIDELIEVLKELKNEVDNNE